MNSTFLGLRPPPGVTAQLFPQYLAWDRSGGIAAASEELQTLLAEEGAGKVVSDLFIAEDEMFPKACAPLRLVHRESGRRLDGYCVPEPDASLVWFLVAARVGRSTVYPQASTNLFDVVADRTINGVVMTDRAGRILWINHRFEKITGWTLDEVRGLSPGSFLQSRNRSRHGGPDAGKDPHWTALYHPSAQLQEEWRTLLAPSGRPATARPIG
ncbi:PAS domain-containing protein [Verrucomicrobium spinosum]|uniref:PAS domain-containing protein n=1 Tax=Verrucomicrobium spinosum TaxID=2736 RepID=UPI0009463E55|nr:PAS domain-containing protein [Verrucomicrobium spinosum]